MILSGHVLRIEPGSISPHPELQAFTISLSSPYFFFFYCSLRKLQNSLFFQLYASLFCFYNRSLTLRASTELFRQFEEKFYRFPETQLAWTSV